MAEKCVLGIRNRIVKFASCSAAEESKVLERMEFKDILGQDFGPLLLQIKDEEWGDLVDAAVPDRSTIKVLQAEPIVSITEATNDGRSKQSS